jgi:hypothetical protein
MENLISIITIQLLIPVNLQIFIFLQPHKKGRILEQQIHFTLHVPHQYPERTKESLDVLSILIDEYFACLCSETTVEVTITIWIYSLR